MSNRQCWSVFMLGLCVGLSGCSLGGGSGKVSYYTLSGAMSSNTIAQDTSKRVPSLGVGPLRLPSLLDRKGYVVRQSANSIEVKEMHEWGGQLQDELISALAQQLQARLPQTRVQRIPWEISQTPKYQVSLIVDQFDGLAGSDAVLRGTFQLQYASDGRIIATYPIQLSQGVKGKTIADIVKVQTQLVEQLAQQIVQKLALVP